jgi:hypothetical protein
MIKNVYWPLCKAPGTHLDFNKTRMFLTDFRQNTQIPNFIKISIVGVKLFHADGQTDMRNVIVEFRKFVNGPKILNSTHAYHKTFIVNRIYFNTQY